MCIPKWSWYIYEKHKNNMTEHVWEYTLMHDITELLWEARRSFPWFFFINPLYTAYRGSWNIPLINTYPSRNPLQSLYLNKLLQDLLFPFLWGTCTSCINLLPSAKAVFWNRVETNIRYLKQFLHLRPLVVSSDSLMNSVH